MKFSRQEMKSTRWWKRRNRNFLVRKWSLRGHKSPEIEIFSSGNEVYEVMKAPKLKFSRQEMKSTRWWKRRNRNFLVRKWTLRGDESAEIEIFSSGNELYEVMKAPKSKFSRQEMNSTRWWKRRNRNFLVRKWTLRGDESAKIEIFSSGNELYEVIKAPELKFSRQEMNSTRWWSAEIEIFSSGNEVYEVMKAPKLKFSRQEMKSTRGWKRRNRNFLVRKWSLRGDESAEIEIFSSGNEVYEVMNAPKLKFSRQEMNSTRWWKRRNWNFLVRKEMNSTRWWKRRNWNFFVRKWSLRGDKSAEIEIFSSGNVLYEVIKMLKILFSRQKTLSAR